MVGPVAEDPHLLEFVSDGERLTMFVEDFVRKTLPSPAEKTRATSANATSVPSREDLPQIPPPPATANTPREAVPDRTNQEHVDGVKVRRFDSSGRERL